MTERRADDGPLPGPDPYWRHDVAIEVPPSYDLTGGFGFRFKIHEATERYGRSHEDLVQLAGQEPTVFEGKPPAKGYLFGLVEGLSGLPRGARNELGASGVALPLLAGRFRSHSGSQEP